MVRRCGLRLGTCGSRQLQGTLAVRGCRLWVVTSAVLLASLHSCAEGIESTAAHGEDPEFTAFEGYIAGDGDIKKEYTTVAQAKTICLEVPDCKGFTFMGGPSESPMWINFKSKWNIGGKGWTSYRRETLPFTVFDGYIAGEGDIAKEYMTLRKAKVFCLKTPGCKGFTFMGGPSEGPMWINFKKEWNIAGNGWTSYRRDSEESQPAGKKDQLSEAGARPEGTSQQQAHEHSEASAFPKAPSTATTEAHSKDAARDPSSIGEPIKASKEAAEGSTAMGEAAAALLEPVATESKSMPSAESSREPDMKALPQIADESVPDSTKAHSSMQPAAASEGTPAIGSFNTTSSVVVTPEGELRMTAPINVYPEPSHAVNLSTYQDSLFVGEFMKMTSRTVVALNTEKVVMCYAQPELGGACRAANASRPKEASETDGKLETMIINGTHLLPPTSWGTREIFKESPVKHIEAVRLTSKWFAVCFEQALDSTISCTLGHVSEEDAQHGLRCSFGNYLTLGSGALISISSASAGRQLVACYTATGKSEVTCRWADTMEDTGTEAAELKWTEEERQISTADY